MTDSFVTTYNTSIYILLQSDSKLFPDEEKTFVFSFFAEKNGVFSEDWILTTSPPLKSSNLIIHLNGMCLLLQDQYSGAVGELDSKLHAGAVETMVNELVLDLIGTIKEDEPARPDLNDRDTFQFYFELLNKQYK